MKMLRGSLVLGVCAGVIALALLLRPKNDLQDKPKREPESPPSPQALSVPEASEEKLPNLPPLPPNIDHTERFSNLIPEQQKELIKKFYTTLKPAVEKWCQAYEGRAPFKPEDLTFDKFIDRSKEASGFAYTFVFNGITLEVEEWDQKTRVSYLATKSAAKKLNDLPQGDTPSAKLPVSHSDVIRMIKADTGVEFEWKDVTIRPTGLGSAMSGGAYVDVAPLSPGNAYCKVSLVFDGDGKLVYYLRDPFL